MRVIVTATLSRLVVTRLVLCHHGATSIDVTVSDSPHTLSRNPRIHAGLATLSQTESIPLALTHVALTDIHIATRTVSISRHVRIGTVEILTDARGKNADGSTIATG